MKLKNKSILFFYLAVAFLFWALIPLSKIVGSWGDYSFSAERAPLLLAVDLLALVVCGASGFFAWSASRYFAYSAPLALGLSTWYYADLLLQEDMALNMFLLHLGSVWILLLFCLSKQIKEVLEDPKKQWWKISPRQDLCLKVFMKSSKNEVLYSLSNNVSSNGILLEIDTRDPKKILVVDDLEIGKIVNLVIETGPQFVLRTQARIVRKHSATQSGFPQVALQFEALNSFAQKRIDALL